MRGTVTLHALPEAELQQMKKIIKEHVWLLAS